MQIGATIRALREQQGWSQEELGFRVQTSAANISRIETGKHGPGKQLIEALAVTFNLKLHELYALAAEETEATLEYLPDQAEARLLGIFRQMTTEQRLLLFKVGQQFLSSDDEPLAKP